MAKRRGRGRPSFENSYKVRRKAYNQYLKKWEQLNKRYNGNIVPKMDSYQEFKAEYMQARKDTAAAGQSINISKFVQEQVLTTKKQGKSAADNFNKKLEDARQKYKNFEPMSDYEFDLLNLFGVNDSDGGITQRDVRSKSAVYEAAVDLAKKYNVGNEAFGS